MDLIRFNFPLRRSTVRRTVHVTTSMWSLMVMIVVDRSGTEVCWEANCWAEVTVGRCVLWRNLFIGHCLGQTMKTQCLFIICKIKARNRLQVAYSESTCLPLAVNIQVREKLFVIFPLAGVVTPSNGWFTRKYTNTSVFFFKAPPLIMPMTAIFAIAETMASLQGWHHRGRAHGGYPPLCHIPPEGHTRHQSTHWGWSGHS